MRIINLTDEYVFIGCDYAPYNKKLHDKRAIFIDLKVYDFVSKCLEPKLEMIKELIGNISLGKNTSKYWEENWHDKFVKEIVDLSHFDKNEVSNSISAYLCY